MINKKIEFIFDFDGVLFNSGYEAYTVCKNTYDSLGNGFHLEYSSFLELRSFITDAWQFNYLFNSNIKSILKNNKPNSEDKKFEKNFFLEREKLRNNPNWIKLMAPYPFFHELKHIFDDNKIKPIILSTRDEESIKSVLDFYDFKHKEILGHRVIKNISSNDSKSSTYEKYLSENDTFYIFFDDMYEHLKEFKERLNFFPVHADWGYGKPNSFSLNEIQSINLIKAFVALMS